MSQSPDRPAVDVAPSMLLPVLAWWGGFFVGPLLGVAAFLTESRGTVGRSHGGGAALFWSLVLLCWAAFIVWVMFLGGGEPEMLLIGLPVVLAISFGACINGTVQIRRGRTPLGRRVGAGS